MADQILEHLPMILSQLDSLEELEFTQTEGQDLERSRTARSEDSPASAEKAAAQ